MREARGHSDREQVSSTAAFGPAGAAV